MHFRTITLVSDSLRIEVLPELGAKIASMRIVPGGEELLQQPLQPYSERTRTMAFEDGDASGIDECIPSISGCVLNTPQGAISVPDHGDFWRIPFNYKQEGNRVSLEATGFSLPLQFQKVLTLELDGLRIDYTLRNIGGRPVDYIWSAHPGFAADPGDRVLLPSTREITVWNSGGARLGGPGQILPWPHAKSSIDLSLVGSPSDTVGDKLFAAAPSEGWVGVERTRLHRRVEVWFDPRQAPWVGIWLSYGGWPEGRVRRQQCVALEPCTAPADALDTAIANGWSTKLAPGASFNWTIEIRVIPA